MRALPACLALCCCAARQEPGSPRETLEAYAQALEEGRIRDAYALLTDEAKKSTPFEAFARMVKENPEEIREIVRALSRPASPPVVTAQVTTPDGESLRLVYEDGAWRIDASAVDLYNQETPEAAVASFVRAFENKRYDVLMRFVPDAESEGLSATKLKQAFEGEQREEVERLTQALRAALPTARVERLGERATMSYGAGGTVELVREQGLWKIEGF